MIHYGDWAIGIIFLLRAIGDFKYFGFAKRIRHTDFALYDTKIYSPLAFAIATASFVIAAWS
jgi:DNA-binding LytR/AlgR family response regulator